VEAYVRGRTASSVPAAASEIGGGIDLDNRVDAAVRLRRAADERAIGRSGLAKSE
jgi:hypothetical protein